MMAGVGIFVSAEFGEDFTCNAVCSKTNEYHKQETTQRRQDETGDERTQDEFRWDNGVERKKLP